MRVGPERVRELAWMAVVLFVSSYAWMFARVSVPNERTRVYLTMALVDHGTVAIDEPLRRFGSVYDLARHDGHYFTDKAPGSSLLAVPIYAFVRSWSEPNDWSIVELTNLFRTVLILPAGVLGFLLVRAFLRRRGFSEPAVAASSLAFSLGSPVLHYSGAFYGHVPVAVLVLAALWLHDRAGLLRLPPAAAATVGDARAAAVALQPSAAEARAGASPARAGRRELGLVAAAGACAGLAGLIEYQAIVLAVVLAVPIAFGPRRRILPGLVCYGLGAAPFAAALLAYNARAFGGPFELSYEHLASSSLRELHGFGLAGATWPSPGALLQMAISQHRGLLVTAPLLGFGLLALPFVFRRLGPALGLTAALGSAYFVLIVASSSVWYGGWSFGLRLLIPVFGLFAIAAAAGFDAAERWPTLQNVLRAAACFGIVYQLAAHASMAELPPEFERPLPDAILPMWTAGLVAPNLGCKLVGLTPWSLVPLAVVAAAVLGWIAACGQPRPRLPRAAACLLLAALTFAALLGAPPSRPAPERERWVQLVKRWVAGETQCASTAPNSLNRR